MKAKFNHLISSSPIGNEEGLVGLWKFNSGSGDILYDHSGNQNHGTIIGATWELLSSGCTDPYADNYDENANVDDGSCTYPDNGEYSLIFDGEDDYVETGVGSVGINEGFAFSFNFKTNGSFNRGMMISLYGGNTVTAFQVYDIDGYIEVHIRDNSGENGVVTLDQQYIRDNQWHNLNLSYNNSLNSLKVKLDDAEYDINMPSISGSLKVLIPFGLRRRCITNASSI